MAQTVERGRSLDPVSRGLWWLGWRPVVSVVVGGAVGLIVGNAIAIPVGLVFGLHTLVTMGGFVVAGVVVGLLGWVYGAQRINETYPEVIGAVEGGTTASDLDSTTYALVGTGEGSKPLVEAHPRYESTFLAVGQSALTVYEGRFDLVDRTPAVDSGVEIPYDRIARYEADDETLEIATTDGETFVYRAESVPAAALAALDRRV